MSENRDRILRVIVALQQKTIANGATEDEAMLAAAKAGELMAQYRLTQSDIEIEAEPVEERQVDRRQREKHVSEDYCLGGIKHYCGVKAWFSRKWDDAAGEYANKLVLFGLRADCDLAQWLYELIGRVIPSEAEKFKRTTSHPDNRSRRRAVTAFRMGMAGRINQRLHQMARAMEPAARTGSGTALVVVRNAVVEAAYAKLDLHLRQRKGRSVRDGAAYQQGVAAGDRVSLNRPVGGRERGLLR